MKTILISIALLETLVLGFYLGQTYNIKQQIQKQDKCVEYVYKKDINLEQFFQEKQITDIASIFIHSAAAVALKYEACMWSEEDE